MTDRLFKLSETSIRNFQRRLLAWYGRAARDLPWRENHDPYRIWVSEIMLQQTQVDTVIPYYRRFLEAFPEVRSLAVAPEQRVLKLWEGMGYYRRARQLQAAARMLVHDLHGNFPQTAEAWMRLPGVGRYTAGAISSIAFGEAAPVVDGNVKRVLARFFAVRKSIDDPRVIASMWETAGRLVPGSRPGDFNQALMELGALVCVPNQPACPTCPLRDACQGRKQGRAEKLPVRARKKAIPHYEMAAAVLQRSGRFLLVQRSGEGLLAGLWEFPGDKIGPDETRELALARLCRLRGLVFREARPLAQVWHAFSHFSITIHAYLCERISGKVSMPEGRGWQWVRPESFQDFALPAAQKKIAEALKKRL